MILRDSALVLSFDNMKSWCHKLPQKEGKESESKTLRETEYDKALKYKKKKQSDVGNILQHQ